MSIEQDESALQVDIRSELISKGWSRGVCIDLNKNSELKKHLPVVINNKLNDSGGAILVPLLYDCALISSDFIKEPWSPVLVCWNIDQPSPEFRYGKSPRTYHFNVKDNGIDKWFECSALSVWTICRQALVAASIDSDMKMPADVLEGLLKWNASRTTRSVFSDAWNAKIEPIRKRLITMWKSEDFTHISDVLLSLQENLDEDKYVARIIMVIPDSALDKLGRRNVFSEKGNGLSSRLETVMKSMFSILSGVDVVPVVMAEESITLSQIRDFKSWNLEYYSYRDGGDYQAPAL